MVFLVQIHTKDQQTTTYVRTQIQIVQNDLNLGEVSLPVSLAGETLVRLVQEESVFDCPKVNN